MIELKEDINEFTNNFCYNHTVLYTETYDMKICCAFHYYLYILNKHEIFNRIIDDQCNKDKDKKGKYIFLLKYCECNKGKLIIKRFKNEYDKFPSTLLLWVFLEEIYSKCHNDVTFIELRVISHI